MMQANTESGSAFGMKLDRIFRARSVCVVGASAEAGTPGGLVLSVLRQTGFEGAIYPVNPKYKEIDGLPCYPAIDKLPAPAEVAVIVIKAELVPGVIQAGARVGTRAAVVLTMGFEEVEGGRPLAEKLATIARENDVVMVGPNCQGIWSVRSKTMLTFGGTAQRYKQLRHAPVAVVSQSGAFAGAIGGYLQESGIGCSYVISAGNETVTGIADYLEWLNEQDDVRVVLMHLEGLRDGERLLPIAEQSRARGIHLVALKTGNSAVGQKAAASHTGKIASPHDIYRDVLDQAGIIQVHTLTELYETAEVLMMMKSPRRAGSLGGVSVASNSGGGCSLIADILDEYDIPLATLQPQTLAALTTTLPSWAHVDNPVDLTTDIPAPYRESLRLIAGDPNTEALVIQLSSGGQRIANKNGGIMKDVVKEFPMPTILSFSGDVLSAELRQDFMAANIMLARDPGEAARLLNWLYRSREIASRPAPVPPPAVAGTAEVPADWPAMAKFLAGCSIQVPGWRIVEAGQDAASITTGLRFPVVVKALPEDSDHKTELGLVLLGISAPAACAEAATLIRQRLNKPRASVLVQEIVQGGVEIVLSVIRTPEFGPILAIGSGGTAVELYKDVGYLALPADREQVLRVLRRLKLWTLLQGFRGRPAADIDALVDAAVQLSARVASSARIGEIEINPLFVLPKSQGVVAVDALVKARK